MAFQVVGRKLPESNSLMWENVQIVLWYRRFGGRKLVGKIKGIKEK